MKKMKNKGFSLVELIVVIAIMAILAITLAPRLSQYVERSRMGSDQEAINTIYTAAKLANLEAPLGVSNSFDLETDGLYTVTDGRDWAIVSTFTVDAATPEGPQEFFDTMLEILGDFELKSTNAGTDTTIVIATDGDGKITVTLDYDGAGYDVTDNDYQLAE